MYIHRKILQIHRTTGLDGQSVNSRINQSNYVSFRQFVQLNEAIVLRNYGVQLDHLVKTQLLTNSSNLRITPRNASNSL